MTSGTQLALFDPASAMATYKVGDWVKLKLKTPHAACLKKGDIVQVEAIHPLDGSCKFWNERTESWGYVYPDEFVLVPPPRIDSVTLIVEPVVTESIVEPVVTESIVEPVVTESIVEPVVTESIVEPVVTESIVEPVVTESNLPENDSVTKSASAISTYRPRGTARSGEYFRFSYRDGGKIRHIHIRGGNTDSPIARSRVEEVRSLLASGVPPLQIAATLVRLTLVIPAICE